MHLQGACRQIEAASEVDDLWPSLEKIQHRKLRAKVGEGEE